MNWWIFLSEDLSQPARITLDKLCSPDAAQSLASLMPLYFAQKNNKESTRQMKSSNKGWPLSPLADKGDYAVGLHCLWRLAYPFILTLIFFGINQEQQIKEEIFNSDMFLELECHVVLSEE